MSMSRPTASCEGEYRRRMSGSLETEVEEGVEGHGHRTAAGDDQQQRQPRPLEPDGGGAGLARDIGQAAQRILRQEAQQQTDDEKDIDVRSDRLQGGAGPGR